MPTIVPHLRLVSAPPLPRLSPTSPLLALYHQARHTTQAWCDADLCLPVLEQHLAELGTSRALQLAYELGVRQGLRQHQGRQR